MTVFEKANARDLETPSLGAVALRGIPYIQPGDDLSRVILDGITRTGLALQTGDALVVTSKIVSKSEGRFVRLETVQPGEEAKRIAALTRKDARIVQLVLDESQAISRMNPGVLVVQHRLGFISANAGIDQSNVEDSETTVLLLPQDPDESAVRLREAIHAQTGVNVAIVISDSHGRPFRMGNVGVAIGVAGMPALLDLRGQPDLYGRALKITLQGYADMVASAANLLTGEGAEGKPIVHLRGLQFPPIDGRATDLVRPIEQDMYR